MRLLAVFARTNAPTTNKYQDLPPERSGHLRLAAPRAVLITASIAIRSQKRPRLPETRLRDEPSSVQSEPELLELTMNRILPRTVDTRRSCGSGGLRGSLSSSEQDICTASPFSDGRASRSRTDRGRVPTVQHRRCSTGPGVPSEHTGTLTQSALERRHLNQRSVDPCKPSSRYRWISIP